MFNKGFEKTAMAQPGTLLRAGARVATKAKKFVADGTGIGRAVTSPIAKGVEAVKTRSRRVRKAVSDWRTNVARGEAEGWGKDSLKKFEQSQRLKKREVGGTLTNTQMRLAKKQNRKGDQLNLKHAPEAKGRYALSKHDAKEIQKANKERVIERAKRLKEYKENKNSGPGFMSKHPLFTLGAGLVAGKAISGGDDQQRDQPPQVMYPQY